ncbi:MAG: TetR/AcrR family transcriptional regulator [Lachnospiraceae bacterium]|nr:TetR/AcrR family transcriptional regulator [Lachnospiraceae bacterium]MBQ9934756.1 TetR/AcrR family transcriptional regulator [Lachnospiraceae bacterium]
MVDSFISRKDRIISSAIEIISDSGLSALTTKNLAIKENMSEALLYKYFGGINEVLIEVVDYYTRFDKQIRHTFMSREGANIQKLRDYMDAYATYYDNYYSISTLMLQYEELLHNIDVREKIAWCITERQNFITDLFKSAIEDNEIIDVFTPDELANNVTGVLMSHILSRRIVYHKKTFRQELMSNIDKWFDLLKKDI